MKRKTKVMEMYRIFSFRRDELLEITFFFVGFEHSLYIFIFIYSEMNFEIHFSMRIRKK